MAVYGGFDVNALERQVHDAAMLGLREWCELVAQAARENVPKGDPAVDPDPGVSLADSIEVHQDGDGFVIVAATPYAAKVHENLRLRHPRGGSAKFLERAITALTVEAKGVVATSVRARTAAGLSRPTKAR